MYMNGKGFQSKKTKIKTNNNKKKKNLCMWTEASSLQMPPKQVPLPLFHERFED